ncbi:hypothetical protein NFI96_002798 [Prochilodus magdalenae]|nr:hypothetical protein NFI96_002798 [Prochilodus magdalenae]
MSGLHWALVSYLTFAWVFNEYPYFVQQDSRRFVSQETGNLYIAKVEPSDVGNYTCVVNNSITKDRVLSSPTPLVLRNDGAMGEYEPKIEVHFPDTVPAAKGSSVKLECFALGNPVPRISWRRTNDVPFPSKVKLRNANAILEIPRFQQEDTGTYECVAENSRGKNAARGRLSFHAKPHWLQTMTDTALSIEENLFWECKASGKPKPSYSWLRNGEPLMSESRVLIENGALTISSLTLSDGGMYQCVAENKHGIVYASAELKVLASPPSFSQSPLRSVLKARAGTEVTLECRPQASPRAISLWKRGSEMLQKNERFSLFPNGTLKIANVTKRDGGTYTCIAKNQFGSASTTGELLITVQPISSQYNQNSSQYNPNSSQYNQNSSQYNQNSSQYNQNSSQYNPNSSQYNQNSSQYNPNSSQYNAYPSQNNLNPSQCNPNSSQYNPNSSQYNPNFSQYKPNSSQYNQNSSQYNPNLSQYKPNSSQYKPNSSQYNQNSFQYNQNTSQCNQNTSQYTLRHILNPTQEIPNSSQYNHNPYQYNQNTSQYSTNPSQKNPNPSHYNPDSYYSLNPTQEIPNSSQYNHNASQCNQNPSKYSPLEHPHTVPADGAVGVEVEGCQAFWTCDTKPSISVLTTVPPHTDSLGVSTKTKAGLVTEDDPLPF